MNEFGLDDYILPRAVRTQSHEYSAAELSGPRPDEAGDAAGRKVDFRFVPKKHYSYILVLTSAQICQTQMNKHGSLGL